MISVEQLRKIRQNAQSAARRYKRRVWWASLEDMEQEAVAAQILAAGKFDPSRGTNGDIEFGAYSWRVAVLAIRRFLFQESTPASGGTHRPESRPTITRVELSDSLSADGEWLDAQFGQHERMASIRARIVALVGDDGAEFAIGVLGGDYSPADVASEHGLAPGEIYESLRKLRRRLSQDRVLWELWTSVE